MSAMRRAARAASLLLLARAEFAAVELAQSGADALHWLLWALGATALLALTLIAGTAAVVLALWPQCGWYSLGLLTLVYAAVTVYVMYRLRRALHARPPLLAETLAELAKDREAVFGHPGPEAGSEPKP